MYRYCYRPDCSFDSWPDGKSYYEQTEVTVKVLLVINDEMHKMKTENSNG